MSAIDNYRQHKAAIKYLESREITVTLADILNSMRFFYESCSRTSEDRLSDEDRRTIEWVCGRTDYHGASISWSFSREAAQAIKGIILRELKNAMKNAARAATQEAKEILQEAVNAT